jgi:hypothetical protein
MFSQACGTNCQQNLSTWSVSVNISIPSSGILHLVCLVRAGVLEQNVASIFSGDKNPQVTSYYMLTAANIVLSSQIFGL